LPDATIRLAAAKDAESLAAIYNHYVLSTIVTFEENAVDPAQMRDRIHEIQGMNFPWFVAEQDDQLLGYAYASPWKGRPAYRFSAEVSVYLRNDWSRRGLGTRLYRELLDALRLRGVHAAIGGIALPNDASVALHQRCGFRKVAQFEEVGFKFGQWIDVGYWETIL